VTGLHHVRIMYVGMYVVPSLFVSHQSGPTVKMVGLQFDFQPVDMEVASLALLHKVGPLQARTPGPDAKTRTC
jgi:hypothetical protein